MTRKILCLAGFLQGAEAFEEKTTAIRDLLKEKDIELVYLNAPHIVDFKKDLRVELSGDRGDGTATVWDKILSRGSNRGWWIHTSKDHLNYGMEYSLFVVYDYIRDHGPFYGILGFSQGAALASIVVTNLHRYVPKHPPLKVAALFAGFAFTEPIGITQEESEEITDLQLYNQTNKMVQRYQWFWEPPSFLETQFLFVMGTDDRILPPIRSRHLASLYNQERVKYVYIEGLGHYLPRDPHQLQPIVQFIDEAGSTPTLASSTTVPSRSNL